MGSRSVVGAIERSNGVDAILSILFGSQCNNIHTHNSQTSQKHISAGTPKDEDDGEGIVVSSAAEALQTPPQPPQSTSLYVNSDEIRSSRGVARSLAGGGESSLANQEILLGLRPDTDTKYHRTLTSIVPIF